MRYSVALLAASATLASAHSPAILGGWEPANVTDDTILVLSHALRGNSYSKSVGALRVCFSDVTSLQTQVVAGLNYLFTLRGCSVTASEGECSSETLQSCQVHEYEVTVYAPAGTNELEVTSIEQVDDDSSMNGEEGGSADTISSEVESAGQQSTEEMGDVQATAISEDEKMAVEAWIKAEGRNEYGDSVSTIYTGGTPLFSETTGTTRDRFDYILSRHPDRPWLTRVETLTLAAVDKAEQTVETQAHERGVGTWATFGALTGLVAALVVLFKRHQRRREYVPLERGKM